MKGFTEDNHYLFHSVPLDDVGIPLEWLMEGPLSQWRLNMYSVLFDRFPELVDLDPTPFPHKEFLAILEFNRKRVKYGDHSPMARIIRRYIMRKWELFITYYITRGTEIPYHLTYMVDYEGFQKWAETIYDYGSKHYNENLIGNLVDWKFGGTI